MLLYACNCGICKRSSYAFTETLHLKTKFLIFLERFNGLLSLRGSHQRDNRDPVIYAVCNCSLNAKLAKWVDASLVQKDLTDFSWRTKILPWSSLQHLWVAGLLSEMDPCMLKFLLHSLAEIYCATCFQLFPRTAQLPKNVAAWWCQGTLWVFLQSMSSFLHVKPAVRRVAKPETIWQLLPFKVLRQDV